MSLFARFVRFVRANLHGLFARPRPLTHPGPTPAAAAPPDEAAAAIERALFALNARLIEGKKQVAIAVADETHVAKLVAQQTAEAAEWERRAVLAIEQGDETLANRCLVRKKEHAARAADHEGEWRAHKAAADRLKESLRALADEVEAQKREQVRLRARARAMALRASSPLEAYFSLAGRRHRKAGEGAFVLEPRAAGGRPIEVRLASDGSVAFSAALGLLPEGEAAPGLALRLLETNGVALVHCAYGLRDGVVVVATTRALSDLGPNEVEAILIDFDLAIARHERDMSPAHNARSNLERRARLMGIFARLAQLIKANLNDLITRSEDPEKMLNQVILDMNAQLIQAKKQVAVSIADEKHLAKQAEQEAANAAEWERRAMLAIRQDDDDLAKEALQRKKEHATLHAQYEDQWRKQKAAVDQLKTALRVLNDKIEEAKRKKNVLIARKKRAEAQRAIHETMNGLRDQSAFQTFERLEQTIDRIEAEAEAGTELAEEYTGDRLIQRFRELEVTGGSDDELLNLKRKMGLAPPAPEPAPPPQVRVSAPAAPPPSNARTEQAERDELAAALAEIEAEEQQERERERMKR